MRFVHVIGIAGMCIAFLGTDSWNTVLPVKFKMHTRKIRNCVLESSGDTWHTYLTCFDEELVNDWSTVVLEELNPALMENLVMSPKVILDWILMSRLVFPL